MTSLEPYLQEARKAGEDADEHGNVWMDDAVPGGIEIASVVLEILAEEGWSKTWEDCQGLRICPRVRVWLDGYQDLDYMQSFLLRVWTKSENTKDGRSVTLTDHLAIVSGLPNGKSDVAWRQEPRLFFDTDARWSAEGLHWWVDWTEGVIEEGCSNPDLSPELREMTRKHNDSAGERDRQLARELGLSSALPYIGLKGNQ